MEHIECSETLAYINQMPGNYPKENTLYSEHGESLKSRMYSITAVTNKHTAKLHHVGSLYILTSIYLCTFVGTVIV